MSRLSVMPMDTENRQIEDTTTGPADDGNTASDVNTRRSPEQSINSVSSRRTPKCAYCRRDHKKCIRASENAKCDRCKELEYTCFGALENAISSSPKRVLNRMKCSYCRATKQKCLPTDRRYPEICLRCRDRGLPCSEPSKPRQKTRTSPEVSVETSASQSEMNVDRETLHSRYMPPPRTNQATPPQTPQAYVEVGETRIPQTVSGSSNQVSEIEVEDANDLTRTSHTTGNGDGVLRTQDSGSVNICEICVNLELSASCFVVEDHHPQPPILHRNSYQTENLWQIGTPRENKPIFFLENLELGTIARIGLRSRQCPFCRLVYNATHDQICVHDRQKADQLTAYASWQLDGRKVFVDGSGKTLMKPRTRRIKLHWDRPYQTSDRFDIDLEDTYIVLAANSKWSPDNHFLGRSMSFSKDITSLTKDWMGKCQRWHFHTNHVTPVEDFASVISERRFKLLDVKLMQAVFPQQPDPQYVALSYAAQETFLSSLHNWQRPQNDGPVDEEKLPRALQDAVKLVRALNFQYLWFHPLCTIFDETQTQEGRKYPRDQNHHIMDQIFGNSFLTICAADEPYAGLVALHTPRDPVVQHIETCAPDLQLMVSHPVETYLKKSKWSTRAWTFQERFLAKRCLIFAAGRVWFQCRDAVISEDIFEDLREPCWSVDMLGTPSQTLGNFQDRLHAIRAYMKCVEAYTVRDLNCPDDILVAFEGFSKMIGTSLNTDLVHGLPSSFLDLALLWEFTGTSKKEFGKQPGKRRETSAIRKFPSWSWCGWESSITYRDSTLFGVQSNITAWISTHTWISWYVRDRYNMLRLLHRFGQEPATSAHPGQEKYALGKEKIHNTWGDSNSRVLPQHPIKWPSLNRSSFFKSVPNLQPDIMDIDSDLPEDIKVRDTEHLQFWTWSAFFRLTLKSLSSSSDLGSGLSRFGILDYKNDFCGTIILSNKWYDEQVCDGLFEFIAISEAKDFSSEEFDGWTYYIPKDKDQREWDLWYVLLVEKMDDVVVRRVALGKMFQEGFENSYAPGKEWREYIMA